MAHIASKKLKSWTTLCYDSDPTLEMVILNFTPTNRKNWSFFDFENNSEVWNLAVDRIPSNSQAVHLYQDATSGSSYSEELVFRTAQITW